MNRPLRVFLCHSSNDKPAVRANDFVTARKHMEVLLPLLRNMESGGYTQKVKVGCELLGIPVGGPRQPLLPLTAEDRAEFEKIFRNSVA
jgi:4-hydroxy-tetrahydrodipicolinate synthase